MQVRVEAELRGPFGQPVDLLEKRFLIGIQTAGEENAFLLGADFFQGPAKYPGGIRILLACQKCLGVGEWKNHIIRRQLHGLGELQSGGIVLSDFERLDGLFEVNVRKSGFPGPGGLLRQVLEYLGVDRLGRLIAAVPVCVVVIRVIVVIRAADLAGDRIVAVPVIGMAAVPVVAGISVTVRPVTAQADEHVLAMVIRIHIAKREP